jgi:hypothetical protein
MARKVDIEEFTRRVKAQHGKKLDVLAFTHTKTTATLYCKKHKQEFSCFAEHAYGPSKGCPTCVNDAFRAARNATYLKKHQAAMDRHGVEMIGEYVNSKTPVEYRIIATGETFIQKPEYLDVNRYVQWDRASEKPGVREREGRKFFAAFKRKYAKKGYRLTGEYAGSYTLVDAVCERHGAFEVKPNAWASGRAKYCPECGKEARRSQGKTHEQYIDELKESNPAIRVIGEYTGSREKITVRCRLKKCRHEWDVMASSLLRGIGCPKCALRKSRCAVSALENELFEFIKSICPDAIQSDREALGRKEIDIYVPSRKLGFEFNGLYWHSDLYKEPRYHRDKQTEAAKRGIKLAFIYEDDWLHRRDVVESTLRHMLGAGGKPLYARKLRVKKATVVSPRIRQFYQDNHMQGGKNVKGLSYGLFDGRELVACMTFSNVESQRGTAVSDGEYELVRYATSTAVVGGAGRLFKAFTRRYNPSRVLSYSDNDLFDGRMYEVLGFDKTGASAPDYKVWVGNIDTTKRLRQHKSSVRRSRLEVLLGERFDPNESEQANCHRTGILRIFNSGLTRWEWTSAVEVPAFVSAEQPKVFKLG